MRSAPSPGRRAAWGVIEHGRGPDVVLMPQLVCDLRLCAQLRSGVPSSLALCRVVARYGL